MNPEKYIEQIKTYLGERFNLPEDQVVVMLPDFINTLSSHMEKLEESLEEDNLDSLAKASHTIKGALLSLGLSQCAEIALQIEQGARRADDSLNYSGCVANLRQIVNDIVNE